MDPTSVPCAAGIGFREPHSKELSESSGSVAWVEIHAENYMIPGGPRLDNLLRIRRDRPVSLHAVGTSLGTAGPADKEHLKRLRRLTDLLAPGLISEHLAWSGFDGVYLNDLLPLPYTEEALIRFSENVSFLQDALDCQILVENPAAYIAYAHSVIPETEFLNVLCQKTGCGLLLDVNNVHVSALNLGFSAEDYLASFPGRLVGEIHLAGHDTIQVGNETVVFDDHGSAVATDTWTLYEHTVHRIGPRPTLIEWDNNLPHFDQLLGEARKANSMLQAVTPRIEEAMHAAQ